MKYSYSVPLPKFIEKRRGDKHGSRNREKFSLLRIKNTIGSFNRIEGQDPMIRILRFRFIVVPAYCETRLLSGGAMKTRGDERYAESIWEKGVKDRRRISNNASWNGEVKREQAGRKAG